jgi:DNA repair protein RadC
LNKRLVEAGELLGIEVLDHIIIGNPDYASMKRRGLF